MAISGRQETTCLRITTWLRVDQPEEAETRMQLGKLEIPTKSMAL
jgi:hypothetical protein